MQQLCHYLRRTFWICVWGSGNILNLKTSWEFFVCRQLQICDFHWLITFSCRMIINRLHAIASFTPLSQNLIADSILLQFYLDAPKALWKWKPTVSVNRPWSLFSKQPCQRQHHNFGCAVVYNHNFLECDSSIKQITYANLWVREGKSKCN